MYTVYFVLLIFPYIWFQCWFEVTLETRLHHFMADSFWYFQMACVISDITDVRYSCLNVGASLHVRHNWCFIPIIVYSPTLVNRYVSFHMETHVMLKEDSRRLFKTNVLIMCFWVQYRKYYFHYVKCYTYNFDVFYVMGMQKF